MSDTSENPVKPGDVLLGKYRVDRYLGMGSMGVVVAAIHLGLGQRVAMKFMLQSNADPKQQYERFLREARAAGRLKSPHVTKVLDVGTLETGTPYLVMEHLEGRDLGSLLAHSGPLPMADAVEYVLQTCEAVGEAHAAGIIHRDIKPTNLFLTVNPNGSPCVKVLDFGISKINDAELKLTKGTEALGSPLYMSPEQMDASRNVDPRSDVWSLGVTLYELLSGITPFHADGVVQVCTRVFQGEPTPLSAFRPDLPAALGAVILRCFEKDRERRWPNVAELAAALAPFASTHAGAYVERVAAVLGLKVEASRPTALLPPEPVVVVAETNAAAMTGNAFSTGARASGAVEAGLGRPKRGILVAAGIGIAVLSLAGFGLVRWRGAPAAEAGSAASGASAVASGAAAPSATSAPSQDSTSAVPQVAPSASVAPTTTATTSAAPSATVAPVTPKSKVPVHTAPVPSVDPGKPPVTKRPKGASYDQE
jgi:serine/threonine-protein kinase